MGKHSKYDRKHQRLRRATLRWVQRFDGQLVVFDIGTATYLGMAEKRSGNKGYFIAVNTGGTFQVNSHYFSGAHCHPDGFRDGLRLATDSDIVMDRLKQ